jgi:hypothetical protein
LLKAAQAALTELPMVKRASGLRPLVPPMATSEPRRFQQRPGGAGEPHMGEEFERKAVLPVGIAERRELAALGRARIVDENVEPAELALDRGEECRRRILLPQVERHGDRLGAVRPNQRRDLGQRLLVAPGHGDVHALGRHRQRDAAPDAAARAGDERDFSLEAEPHAYLLQPF